MSVIGTVPDMVRWELTSTWHCQGGLPAYKAENKGPVQQALQARMRIIFTAAHAPDQGHYAACRDAHHRSAKAGPSSRRCRRTCGSRPRRASGRSSTYTRRRRGHSRSSAARHRPPTKPLPPVSSTVAPAYAPGTDRLPGAPACRGAMVQGLNAPELGFRIQMPMERLPPVSRTAAPAYPPVADRLPGAPACIAQEFQP